MQNQNRGTTEIGQLTEEEQAKFTSFRSKANSTTLEIGSLEIQKARLLSQMSDLEEAAQGTLNAVKARFDVPPEQHCMVTQDGKVFAFDLPKG